MKRKILTFALSLIMMFSLIPTSLAADESFTINGTTVSQSSGTAVNNCSTYASQVLKRIWTVNAVMTTYNGSYNLLKGKNAEERKLTEAHVRTYIQSAPLGSRIRICASSDTTTNNYDNSMQGHTMVLVAKDDSAGTFTVLHAGWGSAATTVYTYSGFADHYIKQNGYYYFFYIADYSAAATNRKPDSGVSTGGGSNNPPKTYTVTLDANGGSVNPSTKSFPSGSLIGELPTPTRSGHVFLGWSTAKEGSGMIVTPGSLTVTEDMTLYAVWRTQAVTFDANGGSTPQAAKIVAIGSVYGNLPVPTRTGYTFDGWYTSANGGTQITSSTVASGAFYITLYAHWSQIPQQDTEPTSFDYSGTFGKKNPFSWALDSTTGTLVISGNGQMEGWQNAENRPWAKLRNKVTKVIVKAGAQNLSQYVVARCENMTSISIPESVTEICDGAFIRAYSLKSLKLPNGLTKIGAAAFSECTSLRSITIPQNVDFIETGAFSGCTGLESIYFCGNAPSYFGDNGAVRLNMFSGCKNLTVYYPVNSSGWTPIIEKYTNVTWKTWDAGNAPSSSGSSSELTPGPWSDWSDTPYQASSTREVETRQVKISEGRTEYRYGRYVDFTGTHDCWCGKYLAGLSYVSGGATLQYSSWTTQQYSISGKDWSCGYCNGNHIGIHHTGADGRAWWKEYLLPSGSYYWEESRWVDAVYKTQYRYRDWISG